MLFFRFGDWTGRAGDVFRVKAGQFWVAEAKGRHNKADGSWRDGFFNWEDGTVSQEPRRKDRWYGWYDEDDY